MSNKAAQKDTLRERLFQSSEIHIIVLGRTSGRKISIPVWFVFEDDKLYLLPVKGSDTQWYKNVLTNPMMRIIAQGAQVEVKVLPVTDASQVISVLERFRGKYGADVKKYYSKFDVAIVTQVPCPR